MSTPSLGITPSNAFDGLTATATHLQRCLGAPAAEGAGTRSRFDPPLAPVDAEDATRRHVDPNNYEMSLSLSSSPPRRKPRALALNVDTGERSVRDTRQEIFLERDGTSNATLRSSISAKVEDIIRSLSSLDRFIVQLEGDDTPGDGSARSQPPLVRIGGKVSSSRLSLSSDTPPREDGGLNDTPIPIIVHTQEGQEGNGSLEEPSLCYFQPLGHDLEGLYLAKKPTNAPGLADVPSNQVISSPWSDSPQQQLTSGGVVLTTSKEARDVIKNLRSGVTSLQGIVDAELYKSHQNLTDAERKHADLYEKYQKSLTRERILQSKLETTTTLLQQERHTLSAVLLREVSMLPGGAPDSPSYRGASTIASPLSCASPTAGSDKVDNDTLDDNELFGATNDPPKADRGVAGWNAHGFHPVPEQHPDNPRAVAALMLSYEMANDVLRCRRQLKRYISLVAVLPSALKEHRELLERELHQLVMDLEGEYDLLSEEKQRCYDSARLRVAGEL